MSQPSDVAEEGVRNVVWAIVWAVFCAAAGGYACGLAIDRFSEIGSLSLWALGALAGYVAQKILTGPSRVVGWSLVIATACALVIAETCWIYWNTKQGEEGWWTAFTLLPAFVQQYELSALVATVCTAFGAWSAYRSTAIRYRLVAVHSSGTLLERDSHASDQRVDDKDA